MRTPAEIQAELDRATERRSQLWREVGQDPAPGSPEELARLNVRIAELWEELRISRVRGRFGSPEPILRRAERDRRLERDIDRLIDAGPTTRRAA